MNFKTPEDKKFIILALAFCHNPVRRTVKQMFTDKGFQVEEEGEALELTFNIHKPSKEAKTKFLFRNLFLEIATKDRDAEFLEFDKKLLDMSYFMFKIGKIIASKLQVLFSLMETENPQEAMDKIKELAPKFERMKIMRIDKDKMREKGGKNHGREN